MPGSKYDKFYIEEMVKKYPMQDELNQLLADISKLRKSKKFTKDFEKIVENKN